MLQQFLIFFAKCLPFNIGVTRDKKLHLGCKGQLVGGRTGREGRIRLWLFVFLFKPRDKTASQSQTKGRGSFEHSEPRPASIHPTASASDNEATVAIVDVAHLRPESCHSPLPSIWDATGRAAHWSSVKHEGDWVSPVLLHADDKTQGEGKALITICRLIRSISLELCDAKCSRFFLADWMARCQIIIFPGWQVLLLELQWKSLITTVRVFKIGFLFTMAQVMTNFSGFIG